MGSDIAPLEPYAAAWADYRRRRWSVVGVVMVMVGLSCFGLYPSPDTQGGQALGWALWAVLVAFVARWLLWPCPLCGHHFQPIGPRPISHFGRNRCNHCGLPRWSMSDPAQADGVDDRT
jgi:hypothetical protein